ncbi:MAG: hypothetical protein ACKVZ0_19315 [Gemmatimonadales bacterium]
MDGAENLHRDGNDGHNITPKLIWPVASGLIQGRRLTRPAEHLAARLRGRGR